MNTLSTNVVTQITIVDCEPLLQEEALSTMKERAQFMTRQPGCVSISLCRSLDRRRIVNIVEWQTIGLLQPAHQSPEFHKKWDQFEEITLGIDPNLYEVSHNG
jgi:hypothetical protein